jgi:S1-C subfamily serine protease
VRSGAFRTAIAAAIVLAACAPIAAEPAPFVYVAPTPAADVVADSDPLRPDALHVTSVERVARRLTVRVRARACGRLATASGVAVGPRLLVTNRHVVEGAEVLELNHWDGASARARPLGVAVADDLALVRVSTRLPAVARLAPVDVGERAEVLVVGYPEGGRQTVQPGEVIEYARLRSPAGASPVIRMAVDIAPGNSGGAVVDRTGALAGIVFGVETETGHGLAIPASAIADLLEDGGTATPTGCP